MALKYTNYVAQPWGAPLVAQQIGLCKKSNVAPAVVMVDIDWSKYQTGFVQLDLLMQSPGQRIDLIKSIYIDNIGMVLPVTVVFPDTQCEVTCQANATSGGLVLTGNLQANVILGATAIALSNLKNATTRVYFSNVDLHPFLNPQTPGAVSFFEASNVAGTPQVFVPKAAGELRGFWSYNFNGGAFFDYVNNASCPTSNIFNNFASIIPHPTAYLVLTDIKAYTSQVYLDRKTPTFTFNIFTASIGPGIGTANSVLSWVMPVGCSLIDYDYRILQDSHGLQLTINPFNFNPVFSISASIGGATPPPGLNGVFYLDMQFSYINTV